MTVGNHFKQDFEIIIFFHLGAEESTTSGK